MGGIISSLVAGLASGGLQMMLNFWGMISLDIIAV